MFQYHHNLLPKAFDNFFSRISSKHNYNTRLASKSTYFIDHERTNYGKIKAQKHFGTARGTLARVPKKSSANFSPVYTSLVLLFGIIWMKN